MAKLASKATVKELVAKYNFRFKKSLGQNFLVDQGVIDKIVKASALSKEDVVVEIGPGVGVLTRELAVHAGKVIAIEIDSNLLPILSETLVEFDNVSVINADVLKTNIDELVATATAGVFGGGGRRYKVVANLPYYITTPILMELLEQAYNIESIVVMIQKEVAERIEAKPGGKIYGALSVAVQYYTQPEIVTKVPGGAFVPPPEVESAVIRLQVRDKPAVEVVDHKLFFQIVKAAFGQRRKTLLNALGSSGVQLSKEQWGQLLLQVNIEPNRRGETLSLEEFAAISNRISST